MIPNNSLSILNWVDKLEQQNHRKWYAYGRKYAVPSPNGKILPFSLPREKTGAGITSIDIFDENDVLVEKIVHLMELTGLEVAEFDDYDLVIYPSIMAIGRPELIPGKYYLRMIDDNGWTKYSELFNLCGYVKGGVEIRYWHMRDFCYNGGHIRYEAPFKNYVFLDADIVKPTYKFEDTVTRRAGRDLPELQVSYKLHRFSADLPEYLMDAMRVIGQHDCVEIFYEGNVYKVDNFLMEEPEWNKDGDLGKVGFEVKTNTVVVVRSKGLTSKDYTPSNENCLVADRSAFGRIVVGSDEYNNHQTRDADGNLIDLNVGNLVLIEDAGGDVQLWEFTGSGYSSVAVVDGDVAVNIMWLAGKGAYYFANGGNQYESPVLQTAEFSSGSWRVSGLVFEDVILEVLVFVDGEWLYSSSGVSSDFTGDGIPFEPMGAMKVKVVVSSANCLQFAESNELIFSVEEQAWITKDGDTWDIQGGDEWIWGT